MHSAHASAVADVPRRWAHANTEITVRVGVGNLTRVATLHVPLPRQPPTAQAPAPALPLVLNWHGMMEDPVEEEGLTDMDRVADEHQFVVAYPKGIARAQIAKSTLPGQSTSMHTTPPFCTVHQDWGCRLCQPCRLCRGCGGEGSPGFGRASN